MLADAIDDLIIMLSICSRVLLLRSFADKRGGMKMKGDKTTDQIYTNSKLVSMTVRCPCRAANVT
eukprot:scaffold2263_cov76-Skeletonema_dohrnii-CCMP3373.AAC.1